MLFENFSDNNFKFGTFVAFLFVFQFFDVYSDKQYLQFNSYLLQKWSEKTLLHCWFFNHKSHEAYILSPLYLVCIFPCIIRNIKKRDAKYCCDTVSLCAIFFIVTEGGLTLPVSMTMSAVWSVKVFYIASWIGEEESYVSFYYGTLVKCQVCN